MCTGEIAKQIFERARLPNDVLGRIWNLADTQQRGALDSTEFVIAMHLLTSYKSGAMKGVPQTLPPGLYEAASRRELVRSPVGSRSSYESPSAIPRQVTGPQRTQSPINRRFGSPLSVQSTGGDWLVTPQEKAQFDSIFATVDTSRTGLISGEQAVEFFMQAQLPEETLAQIWDLADIDADGQLTSDEFAVAMHLVRQVRSGRQPLPQAVPPALIPPSMRRGAAVSVPPTSTVPAQAPAPAAAPATPHSAAEDLFGLDSFSPPAPAPAPAAAPQLPQSTGGSQASGSARGITTQPTASTTFKPFVPTSSFGQSLQPQITGQSGTPTSARAAPDPAGEDLLGDNDPEESKKLTQDTTDLANLSNQVGSLSKEVHGVQEKRTSTDKELSQNTQQKRDFEARLSQARSMYGQEVQAFKALEERLKTSKTETTKLQQEYALIDGNRQDLQNQYSQVSAALAADQQENESLKEKIRAVNAEVAQLKPALEKARSAGRQQKGLAAINKKQLATVEGERDKIQEEVSSSRSVGNEAAAGVAAGVAGGAAIGAAGAAVGEGTSREAVTSPTPSSTSQSTNPFFRRTNTGSSSDYGSGPASPANDQHAAFDSLFGTTAFAPHSAVSSPPPTSFRAESPALQQPGSKSPAVETPSTSPPPVSSSFFEPPPVAKSRQFSSGSLPIVDPRSATSSTAVTPVSHMRTAESSPAPADTGSEADSSALQKPDVPPISTVSQSDSITPTPVDKKDKDPSFDELFGDRGQGKSTSQQGSGFDDAFAAIDRGAGKSTTGGGAVATTNNEFPPIRELDNGDDDSSEDEPAMGFDDNFAPSSPQRAKESAEPEHPNIVKTDSYDSSSDNFPVPGSMVPRKTPPPIEAQRSPPKYDDGPSKRQGSFPPEYGGLLPSRVDPTTPPDAPNSVQASTGAPIVSGQPQQATAKSLESTANSKKPASGPDFEAAFSGLNLAPAKEADDDDKESDSGASNGGNAGDVDFSFDSPQPKATSSSLTSPSGFFGFGGENTSTPPSATAPSKATEHDWDAIFAPLEKNAKPSTGFESNGARAPQSTATKGGREPGWALSADEGDDMILQRLTSMGFPRDQSLDALERYDYNLDKVS